MIENLWQDLRISLRTLARRPSFLLAALLILASSIGATTAIFSLIRAFLLHPLNLRDTDRIVQLWEADRSAGGEKSEVAPGNFLDWKRQNGVFDHLAGFRPVSFNLTTRGEPERFAGALVSADFFRALGVQPAQGRDFLPGEDAPGAPRAALISHDVWRRRFGADPGALGKTYNLNGEPVTVVGVLPADFHLPHLGRADVWMPLTLTEQDAEVRTSHYLSVLARLKPGVTRQRAQAEMAAIARRLAALHPLTNDRVGALVVPLDQEVTQYYRASLLVPFAASAFLLLLACANVGNLQLARTSSRGREIAVRYALGVGRRRLIRQLFLESLLVSLVAAVLGLLFARWAIDAMISQLPAQIRAYVPHYGNVPVDGTSLAFCLLVAVVTAMIFGLAPALRASRPDVHEILQEGGRTGGPRGRRGRDVLVIVEVALAVTLLINAALLLRSFGRLQEVDPGFRPAHVLTSQLDLPKTVYAGPQQMTAFYDQVLERIHGIPGVLDAAVIDHVPMGGSNAGGSFTFEGAPPTATGRPPTGMLRSVSPEYFRALGIPVLSGRPFSARDTATSPPVVIVNDATARHFWPATGALGKRLKRGGLDSDSPWLEVVGVVGNVKHWGLDDRDRIQVYQPSAQQPQPSTTLVIRTEKDPASVATAVRKEVLAVDPNLPLAEFRPLEQLVADTLLLQRTTVILMSFFGAIALLIGGVGIFGILYYLSQQRTHEFGIRMALGASRQNVLQLVLRHGLRLTGIGLLIGLGLAFGAAQGLSGLLFGVRPGDLVTYAGVSLLLVAIALLAIYLPALRASRVSPVTALRYE